MRTRHATEAHAFAPEPPCRAAVGSGRRLADSCSTARTLAALTVVAGPRPVRCAVQYDTWRASGRVFGFERLVAAARVAPLSRWDLRGPGLSGEQQQVCRRQWQARPSHLDQRHLGSGCWFVMAAARMGLIREQLTLQRAGREPRAWGCPAPAHRGPWSSSRQQQGRAPAGEASEPEPSTGLGGFTHDPSPAQEVCGGGQGPRYPSPGPFAPATDLQGDHRPVTLSVLISSLH